MPGKTPKKDPGEVQKWSEIEWGYATLHLGLGPPPPAIQR